MEVIDHGFVTGREGQGVAVHDWVTIVDGGNQGWLGMSIGLFLDYQSGSFVVPTLRC